jgi:hypothetical protein
MVDNQSLFWLYSFANPADSSQKPYSRGSFEAIISVRPLVSLCHGFYVPGDPLFVQVGGGFVEKQKLVHLKNTNAQALSLCFIPEEKLSQVFVFRIFKVHGLDHRTGGHILALYLLKLK